MMDQVIRERYPTSDWNIYAAQASDGENWSDDSPQCRDLLLERILPNVQHYAYIEINSGDDQELWHAGLLLVADVDDAGDPGQHALDLGA